MIRLHPQTMPNYFFFSTNNLTSKLKEMLSIRDLTYIYFLLLCMLIIRKEFKKPSHY